MTPIEIEISESVVLAVIETAAVGLAAFGLTFAALFSYAVIRHHGEGMPPRVLIVGCCYVAPLAGVAAMVLYNTVRIVWVP